MSEHSKSVVSHHRPMEGSLRTYIVGFIGSLAMTLIAFTAVELKIHDHYQLTRDAVIGIIVGLAFVQFLAQAYFFLHLGRETKLRWKLAVFVFMVGVVFILVAGSLWIMSNLNYHMSPHEMNEYMKGQDGL